MHRVSTKVSTVNFSCNKNISILYIPKVYRESVAGSVIQATGTVEFEDGLRMGVHQEDGWCPYSGRATLELALEAGLDPGVV